MRLDLNIYFIQVLYTYIVASLIVCTGICANGFGDINLFNYI